MTARFDISETPLKGLSIVQRKRLGDSRGYLERLFCTEEMNSLMPNLHIVQVNRTLTEKSGTVRGLHFQHPPHADGKLVSCLKGKVFDVAVDLRQGSPTFLRWHAEVLSADNATSMSIPEGFAHGFQTLADQCELLYFHTAPYEPDAEGGVHPQDPLVAIHWPTEITELSPRDASHPLLRREFKGIVV